MYGWQALLGDDPYCYSNDFHDDYALSEQNKDK